MLLEFTIAGAVPSKKNNYRIGKGKLYSPQEVTDYADSFCWQFKQKYKRHKPISDELVLDVDFYYHHDKDLDNMLNTVMDAMQFSGVIKNDKNIVEILARKHRLKKTQQARVDISLTTAV